MRILLAVYIGGVFLCIWTLLPVWGSAADGEISKRTAARYSLGIPVWPLMLLLAFSWLLRYLIKTAYPIKRSKKDKFLVAAQREVDKEFPAK